MILILRDQSGWHKLRYMFKYKNLEFDIIKQDHPYNSYSFTNQTRKVGSLMYESGIILSIDIDKFFNNLDTSSIILIKRRYSSLYINFKDDESRYIELAFLITDMGGNHYYDNLIFNDTILKNFYYNKENSSHYSLINKDFFSCYHVSRDKNFINFHAPFIRHRFSLTIDEFLKLSDKNIKFYNTDYNTLKKKVLKYIETSNKFEILYVGISYTKSTFTISEVLTTNGKLNFDKESIENKEIFSKVFEIISTAKKFTENWKNEILDGDFIMHTENSEAVIINTKNIGLDVFIKKRYSNKCLATKKGRCIFYGVRDKNFIEFMDYYMKKNMGEDEYASFKLLDELKDY